MTLNHYDMRSKLNFSNDIEKKKRLIMPELFFFFFVLHKRSITIVSR